MAELHPLTVIAVARNPPASSYRFRMRSDPVFPDPVSTTLSPSPHRLAGVPPACSIAWITPDPFVPLLVVIDLAKRSFHRSAVVPRSRVPSAVGLRARELVNTDPSSVRHELTKYGALP